MDSRWVEIKESGQERLDRLFPGMGITWTSARNPCYNCIAWAAGESHRTWSDFGSYYWPGERGPLIEHLISVFRGLRYDECGLDSTLEPNFEKIAIYAKGGEWKHAARQLPNGEWTSKLGEFGDDATHAIDALVPEYGDIAVIMRRPVFPFWQDVPSVPLEA